ncbi:MAG: hypothetical protein V4558_00065 [Gemmatimonadota bacterium]
MKRLLLLSALLFTVACGAGTSVGGVGVPLRPIRPEDRVLLGDFSRVNAVAAVFDRVYVAYPTSLGIYRSLTHRWEVPRAPAEPRLLNAVFAAIVDGVDQSVWLAIPDGWLHYRAEMDLWERGSIPGRVQNVAIDAADPTRGVWFQSATGWYLQPRGGGVAMAASPPKSLRFPPSLEDAMRDLPQLRSLAPTLAQGPRLTPGRITTVAPAVDGSGWYLGTTTRGLLYFDRMGAQGQSFRVGLPSERVGALATTDDGLWVATDESPDVGAQLTFLCADLSCSKSITGSASFGLGFSAARQLLFASQHIWIGTDRGLLRQALPSGDLKRFDESSGLTDQRVTALVARRGKVVSGGPRGLAAENDAGAMERVAPNFTGMVYALAASGDTVWAATISGLLQYLPGAADLTRPEGLRQIGGGNASTYGVGYVSDTLVAMTADHLLWRDPVSGTWAIGPELSSRLGRLMLMFTDNDGAWVAGDRGVALVRPGVGALSVLEIPVDIPDQVTSIVRRGRYLWIGTPSGLVRYLLDLQ